MSILTPTFEGIVNSFINNLQATIPTLSTTPISVTREALINPTAAQLSALYNVAQSISVLQNIFEASGSDLDNLAQTYGLTRKTGTSSTGMIYLDLSLLNTIDSITVSAGTIVRSSGAGAAGMSFSIVGTTTFSAVDKATFQANAASIRTQLNSIGLTTLTLTAPVPITSTSTGSNTNVGAYTLNSSSIPNVARVINISSTSGGTDAESDSSLQSRIVAVFTGNSIGTAASLLNAAISTAGVTGGFTVTYGDSLMTRDGSVFDANGNLITPGTGRDIDIYIQGVSLSTNTERDTFTVQNTSTFLTAVNAIAIGQPAVTGTQFGLLPIFQVSSITGETSGATFAQGSPVTDSQGNVIIEGNFALISDVNASQYSILENLTTHERVLATYVSPTQTIYSVVETFTPSQLANSCLSYDTVLFLQDEVSITGENITKGTYNGADQVRYSNVASVQQVSEQLTITDTILVQNLTSVAGGVAITVPHTPIISVTSATNTRLDTTYTTQIIDANAGTVQLMGRFPPRAGDYIQVQYVWQNIYQENLNFILAGDLIDWSTSANIGSPTANVLPSATIQATNVLATQPTVPARLQLTVGTLSDREIATITLAGTTVELEQGQLALTTSTAYQFAVTGLTNIGKLFSVTNATQGYNYNLVGYQLATNRFDPTIGVNANLLPQQFLLSAQANTTLPQPGDKIVLSRPAEILSWSGESDFENNINGNLAPIFDPTLLTFTPGGITLSTPLLDTTSPVTTLAGEITQNITLSGIVQITDDLIINEGVVVDISPSTTIEITPSSQLNQQASYAQQIVFDPTLVQSQTLGIPSLPYPEFVYLFFQPPTLASNFFTIINANGGTLSIRFGIDLITKVVSGSNISYYVGGAAVSSDFNSLLESSLNPNDINTSLKATLLGARNGVAGVAQFISADIASLSQYWVILDDIPLITNSLLSDFSLVVAADNSISFQGFSYNANVNALVVADDILAIDAYGTSLTTLAQDGYVVAEVPTTYLLTYFTTQLRRLSITVEGTLRIQGATPQTSVLFTSGGGANSAPGDWEGIIFAPTSNSTNELTIAQSDLNGARVRFANNGVSIQSSDANVQNCIIRDCLDIGLNISSGTQAYTQYTQTGWNLTFSQFSTVTRLGFATSDQVQLARFPIPDNMVTSTGMLPPILQQLTPTSYIVALHQGVDITVYIDLQLATAIDTSLPPTGISNHSLVPGTDFMIEYDINTGYSLVFLYTLSSKLRNVYSLIADLQANNEPGTINISYYGSISNGLVYNNLIINTEVGIALSSLATVSITNNIIDNDTIGISFSNSIAIIRNNLITGYSSAGIASDYTSLLLVERNDIYSETVVQVEQVVIADTDLLLRSIDTLAIMLYVRTPGKYTVGDIISIDSETMLVQGVNQSTIVVSRGYDNSGYATHQAGAQISIYQSNQIFTVTGINGDYCHLVQTDSFGAVIPQTVPLSMRLLTSGTFRVTFPVDRRADFYYQYRYGFSASAVINQTQIKVFARNQPGIGVNDIVSLLHEIPLTSVPFTPNMENYSADPLYTNPPTADYSYSSLSSLASDQNPTYGSLIAPSPLHRYVGFLEVRVNQILAVGTTRIPATVQPLIVNSLAQDVTIIGIDSNNNGVILTPSSFSFSITADEANLGAVGVFILATPLTLAQSGTYQLQYRQPVSLGTSLPPYYIQTTISYVIDAGSPVLWDAFNFTKDSIGGQIQYNYSIASSIAALNSASIGLTASTPLADLSELGTNVGQVMQLNITLLGNDSSYSPQLVYKFPVLENFELTITPNMDTQLYQILSLTLDPITDITSLLIDQPISTATYTAVGTDPLVQIFLLQRSTGFDPTQQFLLATGLAVTIGDTYVQAQGDLTTSKPAASANDTIIVNYLAYQTGGETLYFVNAGAQITSQIYGTVTSITTGLVQDGVSVLPTTETLSIDAITQPTAGNVYQASYSFEAPLAGETLDISYSYNALVRNAAQNVLAKQSLSTNALVRAVTNTAITVGINLVVLPTAQALSVQLQVANAVAVLLSTLTNVNSVRTLNESDIVRATGNITGISDITVTTLCTDGIIGEVDEITLQRTQTPILAVGSPNITTSQNGQALSLTPVGTVGVG